MTPAPKEFSLALEPQARLDVIDVNHRIAEQYGDVLQGYDKALYCSFHTTAGYLEQPLCARLDDDQESLRTFIESFQKLFPPDADYRHDQLHLRTELSEEQRKNEPRNADSHLTFIGSGLENCVTYVNRPEAPVYFIDLDGVNGDAHRRRKTTVLAYQRERRVEEVQIEVPVSTHPIDSVNFRDPRLGLMEMLEDHLRRLDITKGRVDLSLDLGERHTGLTVNEYETLLMRHDLVEVLRNPFRFMAEKGRNMIRDPRAIPTKAKDYAKYDLVHLVNEVIDVLGISESIFERIIDKFLAVPASRFLRMKRSVQLLVSENGEGGYGHILQGTYQSPILVQWKRPEAGTRRINASFVRFE